MENRKTKKVTFRASADFVDFLDEISRKLKIERSELMRNSLMYLFMSFEMGKITTPFRNLVREYIEKVSREEMADKDLNVVELKE